MDGSPVAVQHFNLKWNNHTNNILQVFSEHLNNESLVDVTISCQGRFLKAHKMVLSACSPYFQELFQIHQVRHPVIIINGMTFLDVKLVVDFMYHGEVKVQEGDLAGLLLAAETLQVKGLANVRNKYDLNTNCDKTKPDEPTPKSEQECDSLLPVEPMEEGSTEQHDSRLHESTSRPMDDDLPPMIKVEPPDIRDIDEEPLPGWDSPRLIIDMKESKETMSDLKLLDHKDRKRPNILRPPVSSIRVASAHLELSDEENARIKREPQEISSSAKCILLSKRQPKFFGSWGRPKVCRIPRPPNAFMIFANDWRRKLASKFPVESNKDISVRLGTMWKNLDADSKETYYSAARKADEEHKQKYPGYYYSPKEARMRKGMKQRRSFNAPPMDALRFVKVFMTNAEKNALMTDASTSLLKKLQPKVENEDENCEQNPNLTSSVSTATTPLEVDESLNKEESEEVPVAVANM